MVALMGFRDERRLIGGKVMGQCVHLLLSQYSPCIPSFISFPKSSPDALPKGLVFIYMWVFFKKIQFITLKTTVNSFCSVCAISYGASVWERAKENIACEWGLSVLFEALKGSSFHFFLNTPYYFPYFLKITIINPL